MSEIKLVAGTEAYEWIRQYGIRAEDVRAVVAAAGGPKWFTTFGLVRTILSDFLANSRHGIDFLGSSVGSWQMTTALSSDPAAALDRLRLAYAGHIYSDAPDAFEISEACKTIIEHMLAQEHDHILLHPHRNLHIITARGKGLLSRTQKTILIGGFGATLLLNKFSRKWVNRVAERVVFSKRETLPYLINQDELITRQVMLNKENLLPSLRASGAIPIMMRPAIDIPAGPSGTYWDGGITDYHISLPYRYQDGIVLHPHFGEKVLPGWFDKKGVANRLAPSVNMSRVLLMYPSHEFVQSLPKKKISDLQDFYEFGTDQTARIGYWNEIAQRSFDLAASFEHLVSLGPKVIAHISLYKD